MGLIRDGCLRASNEDMVTLFALVPLGDLLGHTRPQPHSAAESIICGHEILPCPSLR